MKLLKLKWVSVKSLRILFIFIFWYHVLMEFMLWKAMFDIFKWSGNDRRSWSWVILNTFSSDFQTMIVSDRRSWFGKMIVSDRRSQKKVSCLTLFNTTYLLTPSFSLSLIYLEISELKGSGMWKLLSKIYEPKEMIKVDKSCSRYFHISPI